MTPERGYQLELAPSPVFAVSREESKDQIAEKFVLATRGRFVGGELDSRIDHIQSLSGLEYIAGMSSWLVGGGEDELVQYTIKSDMKEKAETDVLEQYLSRLVPKRPRAATIQVRQQERHREISDSYRNGALDTDLNSPHQIPAGLIYRVYILD